MQTKGNKGIQTTENKLGTFKGIQRETNGMQTKEYTQRKTNGHKHMKTNENTHINEYKGIPRYTE